MTEPGKMLRTGQQRAHARAYPDSGFAPPPATPTPRSYPPAVPMPDDTRTNREDRSRRGESASSVDPRRVAAARSAARSIRSGCWDVHSIEAEVGAVRHRGTGSKAPWPFDIYWSTTLLLREKPVSGNDFLFSCRRTVPRAKTGKHLGPVRVRERCRIGHAVGQKRNGSEPAELPCLEQVPK